MPASDTRIAISYEVRQELRRVKADEGVDTYDAAISTMLERRTSEDSNPERVS